MPQNTPNRAYTYPCYSDPVNFPAQMQEFATDVDTDVDTLVDQITTVPARTSALIFRVAALSVPNNTATTIVWDAAGNAGTYWPGAGSVITVPKTAVYILQANAQWAVDEDGIRRLEVRRLTPSVTTVAADVREAVAASTIAAFNLPGNALTAGIGLSAGNTLEVRVQHNAGAALNLTGAQFSIMEVSQ